MTTADRKVLSDYLSHRVPADEALRVLVRQALASVEVADTPDDLESGTMTSHIKTACSLLGLLADEVNVKKITVPLGAGRGEDNRTLPLRIVYDQSTNHMDIFLGDNAQGKESLAATLFLEILDNRHANGQHAPVPPACGVPRPAVPGSGPAA